MTTEKKTIKVTMSERAPLNIDPEVWQLIAEAHWFNGEHEFQANYVRRIFVREHDDGRRLVYGFHTSGNGGAPIGFRGARGGFLIDAVERDESAFARASDGDVEIVSSHADEAGTVRAIRRVAGIIGDDGLGDECVADLPAQELV